MTRIAMVVAAAMALGCGAEPDQAPLELPAYAACTAADTCEPGLACGALVFTMVPALGEAVYCGCPAPAAALGVTSCLSPCPPALCR